MAKQILEREGTIKKPFEVGTTINGKATNLTVLLSCNGNKGLFDLTFKVSDSQITGDENEDKGTLMQFVEIAMRARRKGLEWQSQWQKSKDDGQTELEFGMEKEE